VWRPWATCPADRRGEACRCRGGLLDSGTVREGYCSIRGGRIGWCVGRVVILKRLVSRSLVGSFVLICRVLISTERSSSRRCVVVVGEFGLDQAVLVRHERGGGVSTRRRAAGWLLVAGVVLAIVGGVVWSREHAHFHTISTTNGPLIRSGTSSYQSVTELARLVHPSHAPAILLFAAAGVVGLVGVFTMLRPTSRLDGNEESAPG